jgi:hypothetical protein
MEAGKLKKLATDPHPGEHEKAKKQRDGSLCFFVGERAQNVT